MSLNDEVPAAAFERRADVRPQFGIRRVDVDEVDAVPDGEVEIGAHLFRRFVDEALAAECDGAHAQARSAQNSVFHDSPRFSVSPGSGFRNLPFTMQR